MTTAAPTRRYTVSARVATSHVHKNLVRNPKAKGSSEFAGLSLDTVENFTSDVKNHLVDVSNLSSGTLDRADYEELLKSARALEAWKPKRAPKTVAATATKAPSVKSAVASIRRTAAPKPKATSAEEHNKRVTAKAKAVATEKITAKTVRERQQPRRTAAKKAAMIDPSVKIITATTPKRRREDIPENWVYMSEHADTDTARAWWGNYCERWLRSEV